MVIISVSCLIVSAGDWNTLVNFGSAQPSKSGQFSVGVNRFRTTVVEIIEDFFSEKVIHSQFNSLCSNSITRHCGRTQVVQINM